MPRGKLTSFKDVGPFLREDVFHLMAFDGIPLDATVWSRAEPGGSTATQIRVKSKYTEAVVGEADFEMPVQLRLFGDFSEGPNGWSGAVKSVKFFQFGDGVGTIRVNQNIDLDQLFGETDSGTFWNRLALDGFKGALSDGNDFFSSSSENDVIEGGRGSDVIRSYAGNDRLFGQAGADSLDGGADDDRLVGGAGADELRGGNGDDRLLGGGGKDVFRTIDGFENDVWTGGRGADTFEAGIFALGNYGATVTDFKKAQGDKVDLSADSEFFFKTFDEIRYIGESAFSGDADVYEIRMENGAVEIDRNGDGEAEYGILLDGLGSFSATDTSWLILPDGFDFV